MADRTRRSPVTKRARSPDAKRVRSPGAKRVGGKLAEYRRKRDPGRTEEPFDPGSGEGFFVVQKHAARRLHYDLRLAMGGVLVSWAVPKGPSYNTRERRLAVHVEDHPLSYKDFEGTIPKGEYGAGSVIVWDTGPFTLREGSVASGSLKIDLAGRKLVGGWALVRMKKEENQWLLIKEKDSHADPDRDVTQEEPESVLSGVTVEQIGTQKGVRQWNSGVLRMLEELPSEALREGPVPRSPEFMKARLERDVPRGEEWVFEIKLDGVRALAIRRAGKVRLVTRNRKEVAFRYPEIATALEELPGGDFVMDGEIVALDRQGRSRFELLQGRIHLGGEAEIASAAGAVPIYYYAFDLLYAERYRLEEVPLVERKQVLRRWLDRTTGRIRFSDHVEAEGGRFLKLACDRGLEGVIAKRARSPYRGVRSGDWVKVKCLNQQELVIGGYTPPRGGRSHFGSLLLGVYEGDRLAYAGKVGTGFSEALLADLFQRLRKLERERSPFAEPPRERGARWVEPKLVAEVRFTEWTSDGKLRHPAFLGLREDKSPRECVREIPRGRGPARAKAAAASAPRAKKATTKTSRAKTATIKNPRAKTATTKNPRAKTATARILPSPTSPRSSKAGARPRERPKPRARPAPRERQVEITNPGKVYYPKSGITKGEVVDYYRTIAEVILPYLRERPLTLVRFPNGIHNPSFFQKNQPESLPDWIPTVKVPSEGRRSEVEYLVCNDAPTLTYIANLGTIDLHPFASRVGELERPDYVVWDLDPPEGGYRKAAGVAPRVREVLEKAGLTPFLKTSGGKGLHLYVPLVPENDHDAVRSFAEAVAMVVVQSSPRTTTLERSKGRRAGKVYVDFMQNGRGKTVVAAYSLRAKEPATVSMPVTWEEFEDGIRPEDFTLRSVPELVAERGDVWASFWDEPASLEAALGRLGSS